VDAHACQGAAHGGINEIVERLGVAVERRNRGHDDGAIVCRLGHEAQVAFVERGFTNHQHHGTAFLELHIGSAGD